MALTQKERTARYKARHPDRVKKTQRQADMRSRGDHGSWLRALEITGVTRLIDDGKKVKRWNSGK